MLEVRPRKPGRNNMRNLKIPIRQSDIAKHFTKEEVIRDITYMANT